MTSRRNLAKTRHVRENPERISASLDASYAGWSLRNGGWLLSFAAWPPLPLPAWTPDPIGANWSGIGVKLEVIERANWKGIGRLRDSKGPASRMELSRHYVAIAVAIQGWAWSRHGYRAAPPESRRFGEIFGGTRLLACFAKPYPAKKAGYMAGNDSAILCDSWSGHFVPGSRP